MKIGIIGTGYVGLVQGACLADTGNSVVCMDIDEKKIKGLKRGHIPIFEPGLAEIVERNISQKRIEFTTSLKYTVEQSKIIFLCLPTPQSEDGSADLTHVLGVISEMLPCINDSKIVVSKSTVPVGTCDKLQQVFKKGTRHHVEVVSNPEFLKEGAAIQDLLKPDRIIIGTHSKDAATMLRELYAPFVRTGNPIIVMDIRSAEITKYAANSFLATKITFMNDLANLCEKVGADIDCIRKGIGSDPRIGHQFLFAGAGFGGSCFPKDVKALVKTASDAGHRLRVLETVDQVNEDQKKVLVSKIQHHFKGKIKGLHFAMWGIAFKPQTDDIREAPSLALIEELLSLGVTISVHDPIAMENAKKRLGKRVTYADSSYRALEKADALIIITEWNEFRTPDFKIMRKAMKHPVIFDGRNIYDPIEIKEEGFHYYCIGRPHLQ